MWAESEWHWKIYTHSHNWLLDICTYMHFFLTSCLVWAESVGEMYMHVYKLTNHSPISLSGVSWIDLWELTVYTHVYILTHPSNLSGVGWICGDFDYKHTLHSQNIFLNSCLVWVESVVIWTCTHMYTHSQNIFLTPCLVWAESEWCWNDIHAYIYTLTQHLPSMYMYYIIHSRVFLAPCLVWTESVAVDCTYIHKR